MNNVIAYIRVSTDGQVGDEKFGLDVQREQISEYCKKHEMNILRWYSDEGESGADYRPGFDEIVYGEITNPPYEAVIVARSDRVARDINVYYGYKSMLLRKEIKLISVTEDFGSAGVLSDILEVFTVVYAKMERDSINKRTSAGRAVKSARGGYSGGRPPFGYRAESGHLVIEPKEAQIVKTIYRMKDDENATYKMIVDYLNSHGFTNRSGTKFSISTVQTIYENRKIYQGYYRYGKQTEWVEGVHEALIERNRDD